jgi:alpha-galactosidase
MRSSDDCSLPGLHAGRFAFLRRPTARIVVTWAVLLASAQASAAAVLERLGNASIATDEASRTLSLSAGGARLILNLDRSNDYRVLRLESPTGRNWLTTQATDTWVVIDGKPEPFGRRDSGFEFERATSENTGHVLRLDVFYRYRPANLRVGRHFTITDGSPTFELWTTFERLGADATLSDLNGFDLEVQEGPIRWLNGLKGDASDVWSPEAFSMRTGRLAPGEGLSFGSQGRSSEEAVPWFAIDGDGDEFFAGLLWSGSWSLDILRREGTLALSFGLTNMSTQLTSVVESPHVIVGAAAGGLPQASAALRTYLIQGIRDGRGFSPLVTYNTWFADGTRIDDRTLRDQMQRVAALGTELFVLDAGWYAGAGAENVFDFHSGLGRWQADPQRFPEGLHALTDYAHELGMKFGVWVEPERVNLDVLGEDGLESSWLATAGGQQLSDRMGQICLAGQAGREWVWQRLTSFIDQVHPDYLKWDNNAWLNCDREGHDHGPSDGNFAHVRALYELLAALRERYPDLLIENVSGGGNRLDFGMLRYTDVGWMDDRSGPSAQVRHNIQGLSSAFPPAYLFSFVTSQDQSERITEHSDLSLYFRSRMMGALGMSFPLAGLTTSDAIAREIATYKRLRGVLNDSTGVLLSDQAQMEGGPPWDAFEAIYQDATSVILYAFQTSPDGGVLNLKPAALQSEVMYLVESVDFGKLGAVSGEELMLDGIDVFPSARSSAHILILTRMPDEAPPE